MSKYERQQKLLSAIKQKKFVTVKELMAHIQCSHATLQRDLNFFEERGDIARSYGGVSYVGSINKAVMNQKYLMYRKRTVSQMEAKVAIAEAAQHLIEDGDTLYITHGTTTSQIVPRLDTEKNLVVVTDGLDIILACEKKPNLKALLMGGTMNFVSMQVEQDPFIKSELRHINVKKLIMGVGGISETHGVTFYDYASFSLLRDIVQQVQEIIIVADHTKFGEIALAHFLPLDKISIIVTDDKADPALVESLRAKGVACILAHVDEKR